MEFFFLLLNTAFAYLFARWAKESFEQDMNATGWLFIFASAWNAAAFAAAIF